MTNLKGKKAINGKIVHTNQCWNSVSYLKCLHMEKRRCNSLKWNPKMVRFSTKHTAVYMTTAYWFHVTFIWNVYRNNFLFVFALKIRQRTKKSNQLRKKKNHASFRIIETHQKNKFQLKLSHIFFHLKFKCIFFKEKQKEHKDYVFAWVDMFVTFIVTFAEQNSAMYCPVEGYQRSPFVLIDENSSESQLIATIRIKWNNKRNKLIFIWDITSAGFVKKESVIWIHNVCSRMILFFSVQVSFNDMWAFNCSNKINGKWKQWPYAFVLHHLQKHSIHSP